MSKRFAAEPMAAGFFLLGGFLLYQALQLSMRSLDGGPGPGLLPAALGVLTLVLAGKLLVSRENERPAFGNLRRVAVMAVVLVGYALALEPLGFVATSALAMVTLMLTFNGRHRLPLALLGLAGAAAAYYLFYSVLRVQLPADPWELWR